MIKCRFFYMRIILLSFLLLFNYSGYVTSCPSSGDGDCVPSKDDLRLLIKVLIKRLQKHLTINTSSSYDN